MDFKPKTVQLTSSDGADRLPAEPNAPFLLQHYPSNWFPGKVGDQVYWLPGFKPMVLAGGVGNVKPGRNPEDGPRYREVVDQRRRDGWIILEDTGEYLDSYDCLGPKTKRKGLYYCERWERPDVVAGKYTPTRDEEGYHRWLLDLVESGTVPPPHPATIEQIQSRLRGPLMRLAGLAETPFQRAKLEQAKSIVEAADAAQVPDAPAPPKRGSTSGRRGAPAAKSVRVESAE